MCSVTFQKSLCHCVIKESPTRPSVCLRVYFIFQSQAVWCTCSKDTIWYFGFLFLFSRGGVSSVPEALSRMGWLHMENMYALHAYNNFNSVPVIEKKRVERNTSTHFTNMLQMLLTSLSAHIMCVSICVCALLISVLVRLLFVILFRVRVCRCVCTVCLNWKAVIKCVDLSTISSSSQRQ